LQAAGTFDAPIVFTGTSKTAGAWRGIIVQGTAAVPAQATLRYATVEYGGLNTTGDGLYLEHARATVTNSTFRAAGRHGLYAAGDARVDIADSNFVDNGNAALRLLDLSMPSVVERLTASGNGQNVLALGGAGVISADDTWEQAGIPYRIDGLIEVRAGATLTVAPGSEIRFAPNQLMQVKGALHAAGTTDAPIVFTGATQTPGSWQGLVFYGAPNVPATGILEHTTVEYGGFGSSGGNIYVNNGAVAIRDSIVRRSAGSGIVLWSNASSSSVTRSQIVENANYGLYQPSGSAWQAVLASNNWWGHPSGPTTDNGCNSGGQGARVSTGIAFAPFLSAADAQPSPVAPSQARQLTIKPDRWFAAASGAARIYVEITLRDGAGNPLAGRTVKLHSTLGTVVDGGITDVRGHTFASLVSSQAGDALLTAELDLDGNCEYARSGQATLTFTAVDNADMLGSDPPAPYINPHLSIAPRPLTRGVPTTVSATLSNPGDKPLVVEGRFSYAQSGIGLAFGPVGEPQTLTIAPGSTMTFATTFTPPIEGHFCIRFEYTYSASDLSMMSQWGNGGDLQENYEFRAPPLPKPLNKWED
ncbi:MAG TPA: hypothetical protein VFT99_04915, partial [Roseiflexaceae bacterium]|nr:hypothetical protein [Roseiflexaceae bacterium]